jgi:multidrug efflux pump subunit AcrA (membrane-fusion protein)
MTDRTIAAIIAAAVLCSCSPTGPGEGEEDEEAPKEPIPVRTAPVRTASFEKRVKGIGIVRALPGKLVQVSAAVEGIVKEIASSEGDAVKAGQPIVRLDDRLARLDLEEKTGARAEAEAALAVLKALPREPDRRAADLDVEKAKVALGLAKAVLDRLGPLRERNEVSEPQLFEARQAVEEAGIGLRAAEARRDVLLQGPRPEAVTEGEAKVARARAAEAAAKARLEYLLLASPIDGVVSKVLAHPGQLLAPGGVAAEVIDPSVVLVTAGLRASEAAEVRAGQAAMVAADGAGGGPRPGIPGKVAFVGPEASAATGLIPVGVLGSGLLPGTAARMEIVVATVEGALAVPEAAVVPYEEGQALAVIRDGKVAIVHPKVGLRDEAAGLVQVEAEGLRAGDLVVSAGAYSLPDGQPVKIEEAEEKGKPAGGEKEPEETAEPEGSKGSEGKKEAEVPNPTGTEAGKP